MSALARCTRYSRQFSRSFQSYGRITAKNYLEQKKCLFCNFTRLVQRQSVTTRSYTALSGDNSSLKYDDKVKSRPSVIRPQYPENYPASPFWQKNQFILYDFQNACKFMYEEIFGRKVIPTDKFHQFMALVQKRDHFTEDELFLIFKSLGLENKTLSETDRVKWIDYLLERFNSLGVQLTTEHYNEVLRNYNLSKHKFSPVEFLSNMEKHGVSPNVVTFSRIVVIYCRMGDIKSASKILDHMRKAQMTVNAHMYKNLILGNFIAGDIETGMKLFRSSRDMGFALDTQMYEAVISGYAINGDLDGVIKMIEEAEEKVVMLPNIISTILDRSVPTVHKHVLEYALSKPADSYEWQPAFLRGSIKSMIAHGYTDMAFKYFSTMLSDTLLLYEKAIETRLSTPEIVKYVEMTKSLGMNSASFSDYFILAVRNFEYETAISILPYVSAEGTMRPQFMWPLIQYYRIMEDAEGIKKLLPFVNSNDITSIVTWMRPALKSLGVNIEEFHEMLKNNSKFTEVKVNVIMTHMLLHEKGLEQAVKFVETCEVLEDIKDTSRLSFGQMMNHPSMLDNWKSALYIYSKVTNCQSSLFKKIQERVDHQELKDYILEKGIQIPEIEMTESLKSLFTEEERQKVLRKSYTDDQINIMTYEELLERRDELGSTLVFCLRLLNKSYHEKDWDVFRETLSKIYLDPSKIYNVATKMKMAYFYAVKDHQMNKCFECIKSLESKGSSFDLINGDMLEVCGQFSENGMPHAALRVLRLFKCERKLTFHPDVLKNVSIFNMAPTEENMKIAKEMMTVLHDNGYFMNKSFMMICVRGFWNLMSESNDEEVVIEVYDQLLQEYEFVPKQYVAVLSNYFKQGNKDGLQAAYDKFTDVAPEQNVLLSLAAAFIENEEMLKAKKVLATPGIRLSKVCVEQIVRRWAKHGQPQHMEVFSNLCSSLPSDIDPAEMKSIQLQALCNKERPDVDACIQFFERHFENDDEMTADLDTLKFYGRFLKRNRPEKVLNHYIMDLINAEDSEARTKHQGNRQTYARSITVNQSSPTLEKEPQTTPIQEKVSEKDTPDLSNEDKFKNLLSQRKFDEAIKISQELTDEQFNQNLPNQDCLSKFIKYLNRKGDEKTMNRIPQQLLDDITRLIAKSTKSVTTSISRLLLEKQPDLFLERIGEFPPEIKARVLGALLYFNDTDRIKQVFKNVEPTSHMISTVFKHSYLQDFKMELPVVRDQFFAILDSEIGEDERAFAYACTMERFHKTNDKEGVDLLAEKAKSMGLNFEELTKALTNKKKEFVETLQELEKSYEEQNKSLPWASTSTWTIDISKETLAEAARLAKKRLAKSLAKKSPSDLIPEEEHHTEVIVAEDEHVDIILKPDEHTEMYALKKEADEMVDIAETVSDKTEPEMTDKAKMISDDSNKGS